MRYLIQFLLIAFLAMVEISFFGSLHGMLRFTPLVFVVSVYLFQHHRISSALAWMIIHGFLLDVAHMSLIPPVTIAYVVAAIIAAISARRIFSHRSIYGVLACALLSYFGFAVVQAITFFFTETLQGSPVPFSVFLLNTRDSVITLIASLILLFLFAKRIRHMLEKAFLIQASRQTY